MVYNNLQLATLLVKTVRDCGGGTLVDNTENNKTGDGTGVLGGLALIIVEVGRDGGDGVGDLLSKVGLSGLLHLDQDHCRDILGGSEQLISFNDVLIRKIHVHTKPLSSFLF